MPPKKHMVLRCFSLNVFVIFSEREIKKTDMKEVHLCRLTSGTEKKSKLPLLKVNLFTAFIEGGMCMALFN